MAEIKRFRKTLLALPALVVVIILLLSASRVILGVESLLVFISIGFMAQLIDGTIGMAYGVISNSFLLSTGVLPALASASIHTAEIFTTLTSGVSHLRLGNVDKHIFRNLVIPGVVGGCIGAYLLSSMPVEYMKIVVNLYLLAVGVIIIYKAVKFMAERKPSFKGLGWLGGAGGLLDAIGGGGWGPIVTSTLIARNHNPRLVVGSVNLAEFFVTVAESATFFIALGMIDIKIVLGLAIGGLAAAPLAAYLCRKAPTRLLMILIGIMLIFLNLRNLKII